MPSQETAFERELREQHEAWLHEQREALFGEAEAKPKAQPKPNPYRLRPEHIERMTRFYEAEASRYGSFVGLDLGQSAASDAMPVEIDREVREQLRRLEALRDGTTYEGERRNAQSAIDRTRAKHGLEAHA